MFKKKKLLLMFVGLMFFVSTAVITMVSAATPPQSLGYEGFLTNASGVAPSATYTVIFRIYDDLTGGTLLYSETQQVVVTSGFLSAPIGNGTRTGGALSISLLPFNQQYFVSVEIQQLVTGEMSPRTAIQSTSYSRTAYGLVASSSPPIGSVKGQLYYDTDDDSVYSYNGTVWNVLASSTTTISGATTTLTSNVTNINSSTTNLIASNTSITSTGTTTITSSTTTLLSQLLSMIASTTNLISDITNLFATTTNITSSGTTTLTAKVNNLIATTTNIFSTGTTTLSSNTLYINASSTTITGTTTLTSLILGTLNGPLGATNGVVSALATGSIVISAGAANVATSGAGYVLGGNLNFTIGTGNITSPSNPEITISGGSNSVLGAGVTITVPDANSSTRGLVTTGAQNFAGVKTFVNGFTSSATSSMSGVLNMNSNFITNLASPINSNDAANKSYVDATVSAGVATTSVISLGTTTAPGAPTSGDRYLLQAGNSGYSACTTNNIAQWNGSSWFCNVAATGTSVLVTNTGYTYQFNGSVWVQTSGAISVAQLTGKQGGDASNYYFLGATDYNNLTSGSAQLAQLQTTGAPSFTGINVSGTTTLNGIQYIFPATQASNTVLSTNGSGVLSWITALTANLATGNIFVGNGAGQAASVSMSGDATINSSGAITLANSGVAAGIYGSTTAAGIAVITVDSKGRIISATTTANLSAINATLTNATITNLSIATLNPTNLTATNGTITNSTSTNFFTTLANLTSAIISTLTATNASIATLFGTSSNFLTSNASTSNIFTLNFVNATGSTLGVGGLVVASSSRLNGTTTFVGGIDAYGNRIQNVTSPTQNSDAANKSYVDALVQGLAWQNPVINFATTTVASTTGDRYIIATTTNIGFSPCLINNICQNIDVGIWSALVPATSTTVYVTGLSSSYTFNGNGWISLGASILHNSLMGIQGGTSGEYYHLNNQQWTDLTSSGAQLAQLKATGTPTFAGLTLNGNATFTTATMTNATATNLFAAALNSLLATFTNLIFTNGTGTNITATGNLLATGTTTLSTTSATQLSLNNALILASSTALSTTSLALYNNNGALYWNGSALGGLPASTTSLYVGANGGVAVGTSTNIYGGNLTSGLTLNNALVLASSTALSTTSLALYNNNGALYWNGSAVSGTTVSATQLYGITQGKISSGTFPDTGTSSTFATVGTNPIALAFDTAGNLYTANWGSANVSKITPAGVVTLFATVGSGPIALAFDTSGNLYTANYNSNTVSKITPAGVVSTFATVGLNPYALAFDTAGNLYTANVSSNNVSKITPAGVVSTFATVGTGPYALAFDTSGNLYTANYDSNTVSKITPAGVVTPFAAVGTGPRALAFDTIGNLYTANQNSSNVSKITGIVNAIADTTARGSLSVLGTASTTLNYFRVSSSTNSSIFVVQNTGGVGIGTNSTNGVGTLVSGLTLGYTTSGGQNTSNVLVLNSATSTSLVSTSTNALYNVNGALYWNGSAVSGTTVSATQLYGITQGKISSGTFPDTGTVSVFATVGVGTNPLALAFDTAGNLYTANSGSSTVSKITPAGVVSTFATVGLNPYALTFDTAGNLYTANYGSNTVSKTTPTGVVTIFATVGSNPQALAFDIAGNLYTANYGSGTVSKITPAGATSTFATVSPGPIALAFDIAGNLYTANVSSNNVSKITPTGVVSTFATVGSGPIALAFDTSGNLYTANYNSNTVSKITPAGVVSTFATVGLNPYALTFDTAGNLYTANVSSNNVSKITPAGVVSTFATVGTGPYALAFDTSGNLYTANYDSNTVSKITPAGVVTPFAAVGTGPRALAFDTIGNLYTANQNSSNVSKITGIVNAIADTTARGSLSVLGTASTTLNYFRVSSSTNSSIFVVQNTGGVGIGTTTNIYGGNLTSGLTLNNALVLASSTALSTTSLALYNNNGALYWNGSAVVKFNTDGSLSVGTTTIAGGFNYQAVATTSNILNIASSTGATVMRINNAGAVSIGTTSSPGFFTVMGTSTSNIAFFGATGGTGCALTATGALNCSSDASFKKNIDVTTYGLDAILSLSPKAFNWNFELDGATKTLGFIAQDVQGIVPELVTTDSNGKLALNQTGLIPLLVNAMKEMNAKIFSSATTSAITIEEITASSTISVDAKLKALGVNAKQANEMLAQLASSTSATSSTTTTETVTYSTSTQSIWTNASGTACAYNFENGCNLSSTTLVMIPATTTTSTTTETFVGKLIARIIGEVKAFFGKEIITEKICVGTANDKICLNKIQLESLLNANPPATTSNPSPASTSTPESTPIVPDTVPTTETTSAPAPEPTPEPAI